MSVNELRTGQEALQREVIEYLMLFSIGPVQEFINQARRTRDLWFGSFLLSEMSRAGASEFVRLGGRLIYPALVKEEHATTEGYRSNAPNKILGRIHSDHPEAIAKQIRYVITGIWKRYARAAMELVEPYVNIGTWNRQVSDLVEFYATWADLDKIESSGRYKTAIHTSEHVTPYSYALHHVESLMAARKLLRDFKPNVPGMLYGEKKSSLDGGRESVWRRPEDKREKLPALGIHIHEELDAISVIKRLSLRLVPEQQAFKSVCETAFLPYEHEIRHNPNLQQAVKAYLDQVSEVTQAETPVDARLFYPRRVEDYLAERFELTEDTNIIVKQKILERLELLYTGKFSQDEKYGRALGRPSPYYAFLVADGDHMGRQLRKIRETEQHIQFSEALSNFANKAASIMEQHQGRLVYGGGDDVMAYLPVHRCLDAAEELRICFSTCMQGNTPSRQPSTLSIGIVIAHMLEPLEEVRRMASASEKLAKETRDTLAIHFYKRSGGDHMRVAFPFSSDPVGMMKKMKGWKEKNFFSAQFAYELRELYRTYMRMIQHSAWSQDPSSLGDLLLMEIERLIYKKKPECISTEELTNWFIAEWKPWIHLQHEPLKSLQRIAEQCIVMMQMKEVECSYD
ncbi:CRISPR-associated protein Cmr2 [Paenibacillus shirakamiensis]|uniref:CRISPR-associated protein Cmr2 n=1 Tax=Paenibacillus shirakamiensis TaxID=1265935 RepID=A0ABS4JBK3_9BACL|nr:type III-B CRISPR-associated protein Cas10/Cmr2 [Paenibacillus shirakamiensis]MBP1999087.1 CRISPR-associated protein Cmr2 [Paenibacillus shirakamiensis]